MRRILWALMCAGLFLAAMPSFAADWPQFRGPRGSAVSAEKGLPTRWSQSENLRWKAVLPGRGVSCPVIAAGRVYVTACSGYQQYRLHVLCFDEATGQKLWERQFSATGNTMCNPKTCMAAPTPVTDGERVYALFATGDLAGLDRDGDLLWYRSLLGDYPNITNQVGMAASPILWKNLLFLPLENVGESFAAALDKWTGQNRWKVERRRDINWVTPQLLSVGERTDVLFQTSAETTAYAPETGQKRWCYEAGVSSVVGPSVENGLVLVAGGELRALKPPNDKEAPEVVWKTNRLKTGYASTLVYQNRVYTINPGGVLNCADIADGKLLWQQRLNKGPFWASPVAADGNIYIVNEEGVTTVVQTGEQPRILSTNPVGEEVLATPAIANGAIFLRSDRHLYCIGNAKGT